MRYEPSIDGLRAFAVLSVVLFHLNHRILPGGWIGVEVFFVLSGYLITRILDAEMAKRAAIDLKKFYLFRFLRLAPALLVLLTFIAVLAVLSENNRSIHIRSILASLFYYMNWSRAFHDWSGGLLAHTWSLSIEEQFYFLWPFLYIALHGVRHRALWIAFALVIVVAWRIYLNVSGAFWLRTYLGSDTHCDGLLLGCFIAVVRAERWAPRLANSIAIPIAVLVLMSLFVTIESKAAQTWGISAAVLSAGWILVALGESPGIRGFLSHRWLVQTGRISYGWYLWHMPIFIMGKYNFKLPNIYVEILVYFSVLVISYLVALASYKFIELPALRVKDIYKKRSGLVTTV